MELVLMHGTGNAFAVLDGFREAPPGHAAAVELAVAACDKRSGLGVDGLLVVEPADGLAAGMRVYNADGSVAEMCGNGLRCVGKLLADRGLVASPSFAVATGAGPREVEVLAADRVRVSLGPPIFEPDRIPTTLPGTPPIEAMLALDGEREASAPWSELPLTCVSMGNPHAVTFVPDVAAAPVGRLGPAVERHPAFPRRTNVEFVEVVAHDRVRLRIWERGVGETNACGTGAAASVVAGVLTGRTGRTVTVVQRGGEVVIDWPGDGDAVFLTGEVATVGAVTWPES